MELDDGRHLFIPVAGSNEVVTVPIDELPEEVEDLLDILRAEEAPLALWLDFAKAYLAQGSTKQYLYILKEGTSPEAEEYFGKKAEYERIQAFCALAAYHTRLGRNEHKDRAKRNDEFQKANTYLNTARAIKVDEQLPHIGLGQLALAKGDLKGAADHFNRAQSFKSHGETNVMGMVSMANVLVKQKKFSDAFNLYSRALKEHPEGPPEMRLGLGICLFQMGQFDRARAAYERVLQLDPANCDALLGLAVLELNSAPTGKANDASSDQTGLKAGLELLCQAYESDPGHPGILSMLAQVCLKRGDYEKTIRLASTAAEGTDLDRINADSLTQIARANHALGKLQEAYRFYQQASKASPHAPLPLFGLAQLSLLQPSGEHTNAISLLETALTHAPGWNDALKILGQLYPQTDRKGRASIEHFREAAQKSGSSSEVWEMLADLLAPTDPAGSLAAYKKAIQIARDHREAIRTARLKVARRAAKQSKLVPSMQNGHAVQGDEAASQAEGVSTNGETEADIAKVEAEVEASLDPLPPKLLNNAAVLHMRVGDIAAGAALFQEALEGVDRHGSGALAPGSVVTLGYNRARAREAAGGLRAAAEEYKRILEAFPTYTDCYVRLACIASARGASAEALDWANKALGVQPDNPDVLALLGLLHLRSNAWAQAESFFTQLTKQPGHKHDAYAWLGLATLNLYSVPVDRRKDQDAGKASRALQRAADSYRRVLEKNESDIYAANGIGAVLAERGHLTTAREIFTGVQEAAAASEGLLRIPDVAVNLGNLHLAQQEYVAAIQMYQSTLRRFYGGQDASVMLYLSRAFYDSDRLPEARSTLLKAAHLQPTNHQLRFNIALTMQEFAVRTLRKKRVEGDPNKLEEFQTAAMYLAQAHRFFVQLSALGESVTHITPKRLETHIAFCADTHQKASGHLELAQREADALEARRQQSQKALEASQRQKELEEERKRAADARAREREERLAQEATAKLDAMRAQWRESAALQQVRGQPSKAGVSENQEDDQGAANGYHELQAEGQTGSGGVDSEWQEQVEAEQAKTGRKHKSNRKSKRSGPASSRPGKVRRKVPNTPQSGGILQKSTTPGSGRKNKTFMSPLTPKAKGASKSENSRHHRGRKSRKAADEGDADKVDKRRKKKKVDAALQGDDDELEYEPGPEDDEREYVEDDAARARLAGTGLLSDDEDEEAGGPGSPARGNADGEGEDLALGNGAAVSRLKRRRAEEDIGAEATAGVDLMEEEDEGEETADAPSAKKSRKSAAILEDSDDEDGAGPQVGPPQGEEGAGSAAPLAPDDLFGSESE